MGTNIHPQMADVCAMLLLFLGADGSSGARSACNVSTAACSHAESAAQVGALAWPPRAVRSKAGGMRRSSGVGASGMQSARAPLERALGAIVRGPRDRRRLALVFTGHEFAEGAPTFLAALAKRKAKASFFLTGDFLADPQFAPIVHQIVKDGHYLGPHSDKHLLYCEWTAAKKTLVSEQAFTTDLRANLLKIARLGVEPPRYFLPPYEHFNADIGAWTTELGLELINYTPGTRSSADYLEDGAPRFVPSRAILESIVARERGDPNGLNGFLLLLHAGAGPKRSDKFHALFGELLDHLAGLGYEFVRVDELLETKGNPK